MSATAKVIIAASRRSLLTNGRPTRSTLQAEVLARRALSTQLNEDRESVLSAIEQDESVRNSMAYSLAMASSSKQKFPPLTPPLDKRMKEQLRISKQQRIGAIAPRDVSSKLPRTLDDALRPTSHAMVITEIQKPFKVLNVNKAWEGLCGYTHVESYGKSLGELIQGPETDPMAITALMAQLLQGEAATTVLTNYTKSGRKFQNRLSVGPLYDQETGKLSQFVGILQEV